MQRFWRWFDRLNGLRKLLLILLFLAITLGAMSLGFATEKHNPYLVFGGLFFFLLLFLNRFCFLNQEEGSKGFHVRGRRP